MFNPLRTVRRTIRNSDSSRQALWEIRDGVANQSGLINRKMHELIQGIANQSQILNTKLNELISLSSALLGTQNAQAELLADLVRGLAGKYELALDPAKVDAILQRPVAPPPAPPAAEEEVDPLDIQGFTGDSFQDAMKNASLFIADKTYNTAHPDYNANDVRNWTGKILGHDRPCSNVVYAELLKLAQGDQVPDLAWESVLKQGLEEIRTVPHAGVVFERMAYIEQYIADLSKKYEAHYVPGWVNLVDALFLYWLVRQLKPRRIVQTGVCNGLSSAFMMLALAKNGPDGTLHVIDLPMVVNLRDPRWQQKGRVYCQIIPEGKTSGWIVPDEYSDRFEVQQGNAKKLLPAMIDRLDGIDMFYHDSDHSYAHMMFEFRQAKRKLRPGGLIVADDIAWNSSTWDFADECKVPSYNYKGTVGVAFF